MKQIKLHNGMFAKVSDQDFDYLSQFHWTAHKHDSGNWYAERVTKEGKTQGMHRDVLKAQNGYMVDHADRDGLNNQRENLRAATRSENNANRRARLTKLTSKYLGVAFEKDRQAWTARIRKDKRGYRLGSFNTEEEAAIAYNNAAVKLHGEFANLNTV